MYSTNWNWRVTSILDAPNIVHAKNENKEYLIIWLNSLKQLKNESADCRICQNEIKFVQISLFLLLRVRMNLRNVKKSFGQFGTLFSWFCSSALVERTHIPCDVFSNEDEKPTWSEEKIQKLHVNEYYKNSGCTLSHKCHHISSRWFPIEWVPLRNQRES